MALHSGDRFYIPRQHAVRAQHLCGGGERRGSVADEPSRLKSRASIWKFWGKPVEWRRAAGNRATGTAHDDERNSLRHSKRSYLRYRRALAEVGRRWREQFGVD